MDEPSPTVEHDQGIVEPASGEHRAAHEQIDLEPRRNSRNRAEGLAERGGLQRAEIKSVAGGGAFRKEHGVSPVRRSLCGGVLDLRQIVCNGISEDHLDCREAETLLFRIGSLRRSVHASILIVLCLLSAIQVVRLQSRFIAWDK